jgi:hypothetical protein
MSDGKAAHQVYLEAMSGYGGGDRYSTHQYVRCGARTTQVPADADLVPSHHQPCRAADLFRPSTALPSRERRQGHPDDQESLGLNGRYEFRREPRSGADRPVRSGCFGALTFLFPLVVISSSLSSLICAGEAVHRLKVRMSLFL